MIKALITVYFPADSVRENIRRVSEQVDYVYICDNSPQDNKSMFSSISHNINYEWFGENLGLSMAFNRVLEKPELFCDEDYIIFFDQDSSISDGHVCALVKEFERLTTNGLNLGCLAPVFFNTSNNTVEVPRMKTTINENSFIVSSVITSSMLCEYKTIKEVGMWNDRVFLDMADWDFCWRIKQIGKVCAMTNVVTLKHSLGIGEKKIGPFSVRVGSPFREYYQTRECLYLLTRKYTPFKFRVRFIAMLTIRPVIHLIFLEKRKVRLKYILKGIKDFFASKTGAL